MRAWPSRVPPKYSLLQKLIKTRWSHMKYLYTTGITDKWSLRITTKDSTTIRYHASLDWYLPFENRIQTATVKVNSKTKMKLMLGSWLNSLVQLGAQSVLKLWKSQSMSRCVYTNFVLIASRNTIVQCKIQHFWSSRKK